MSPNSFSPTTVNFSSLKWSKQLIKTIKFSSQILKILQLVLSELLQGWVRLELKLKSQKLLKVIEKFWTPTSLSIDLLRKTHYIGHLSGLSQINAISIQIFTISSEFISRSIDLVSAAFEEFPGSTPQNFKFESKLFWSLFLKLNEIYVFSNLDLFRCWMGAYGASTASAPPALARFFLSGNAQRCSGR